jgi:type I restriction enzyme R subunit
MAWLAKWIREHVPVARVLIITDRKELDEQIDKVFKGVEISPNICQSKAPVIFYTIAALSLHSLNNLLV